MAFFTGYVLLPINNYLSFKNAVAGNGYDSEGFYGDQCWDLTAELWYNVGFPVGYPQTGPDGYAYECWAVSRNNNISYNGVQYFDLIYNITDVKQGDVVVWDGTVDYPTGHIGLADEDYNGSGYIAILGQNQGSGGTPTPISNPAGGTTANVKSLSVNNFLGAFRYKGWEQPTPPTPSFTRKHRFPWVLYAKNLRNRAIM